MQVKLTEKEDKRPSSTAVLQAAAQGQAGADGRPVFVRVDATGKIERLRVRGHFGVDLRLTDAGVPPSHPLGLLLDHLDPEPLLQFLIRDPEVPHAVERPADQPDPGPAEGPART